MTDIAPTPSNQYSFSRLKTFNQCPLRYRFRYLQGLKEAFRSIESFMGTVVHDVLEWLYRERDGGTSPDLPAAMTELADRWQSSWSDEIAVVRLSQTEEESQRCAREIVERFLRGVFERDRSQTLALEQRLSQRLSETVMFTGFADRIGRTTNGRLFVIDYKTSRSVGDPSEFSEGLQAPLYAACALERHDDDEALAGYHYLRPDTTHWHRVSVRRGHELLDRFLELAEEIDRATDHPARPGVLCAWCGFNAVCPSSDVPDSLSGGLRIARDRLLP